MAIQNEPTRIQIPFADSGAKNVIPDTNPTPSASQAASWTDGFPTQCSLPLASGGIPPARADFNGVFNTMSQSIRFGQEGGVWTWDATVDYAANRVVLGSDGLLYWSVAQSGPNVGGAQNPTADTAHVYWSTMPTLTPSLADDSSKAATTEWVKDLAVAPVYLASNGSDSNDGLSAATAVQTFAAAVDRAKSLPKPVAVIIVAAGSYTGGFSVVDFNCFCIAQGGVSITGDVELYNGTFSIGASNTYTFTINGNLKASSNARFSTDGNLTIVSSNGKACYVEALSFLYVGKNLSITANDIEQAITASKSSLIYVVGATDVTGTGVDIALNISSGSTSILNSLRIHDITSVSRVAITCNAISNLFLYGNLTIETSSIAKEPLLVDENSLVRINGNVSISNSGNSSPVLVMKGSVFLFFGSSFSITSTGNNFNIISSINGSTCIFSGSVSINATRATHCFYAELNSFISFFGFTVSGTFSGMIMLSARNAIINLSGSSSYGGRASGTKYTAYLCGAIFLSGIDPATLPGTGGSAKASSFGYVG